LSNNTFAQIAINLPNLNRSILLQRSGNWVHTISNYANVASAITAAQGDVNDGYGISCIPQGFRCRGSKFLSISSTNSTPANHSLQISSDLVAWRTSIAQGVYLLINAMWYTTDPFP